MNPSFFRSTLAPTVLWLVQHPIACRAALVAMALVAALVAAALSPSTAAACVPISQGSGCGG